LQQHILVDGFQLVFDLENSHGSRSWMQQPDANSIDLYGFYTPRNLSASIILTSNARTWKPILLAAAKIKVANSDVYTRSVRAVHRNIRAGHRVWNRSTRYFF